MKKLIFSLLFFVTALTFAPLVSAQTPPVATQTRFFAWDITDAPDLATAQSWTYNFYFDTATNGLTFSDEVKCSGAAAPFTCQIPIPAFVPGPHTVRISVTNEAGEGEKSDPLSFTFVATPGKPINIRLK
jgi:hypothetical protein